MGKADDLDPRRRPLRVFTWHVHGNYLYYLTHSRCQFYVPVRPDGAAGYSGRGGDSFPWPDNLIEVPEAEVKSLELDVILFQSRDNYETDQYQTLSPAQRRLPRICLEHDPPREHPTDTRHWVDDPAILLVHVTPFNNLMWDSGATATTVIEHGVVVPKEAHYTGELQRGLVVINNLPNRGRRLGRDVFEHVQQQVPLDLVGMGSEELGGLGEILPQQLPEFAARYRFMFNPIRYTSLGLAVCEAMMVGLPVVGLATTEMATAIQNNVSGFVDTNVDHLIRRMLDLLEHPDQARRLSQGARSYAQQRFGIERFARDWERLFRQVTTTATQRPGKIELTVSAAAEGFR
ncbi:MAG TPA: glycosyltransferase family 4 protein [Candidatus Saccharimonadales bacterium]|nr:glycosyltransferase family 4 protein [Candidatus Saccharimonadales bacterium]